MYGRCFRYLGVQCIGGGGALVNIPNGGGPALKMVMPDSKILFSLLKTLFCTCSRV